MDVILSIRPKFVRLIESSTKCYELRRVIWGEHHNVTHVFVFETAPISAVVGYFTPRVVTFLPSEIRNAWRRARWVCGVSEVEFMDYFAGANSVNLIGIESYCKLFVPLSLSNFGLSHAPQNFAFCKKSITI